MRYKMWKVGNGYWSITDTENPQKMVFFPTRFGDVALATKADTTKACNTLNRESQS